ncbi:MAG: efflux RND transporter periplasmic adaptor subunit [Lewinellaceae bacterium]|nr:efflux RND transporter periplasmic adaptor subunit [Phaeodactylibacter sp.]MCB9041147.1 efflux RND transporter periplasmic adaptor subunit [Lewinellaceae bacterium]
MKSVLVPVVATLFGMMLGARFFSSGTPEEDSPLVSFTNCSAEGAEQVFTCAMHNQVRLRQPGICPACGMHLVETRLLPHQNSDLVSLAKGELLLANVRTQKVGPPGETGKKLMLNGRVVPDESQVYEQLSYLPGRIEKLYVNKTGMHIQKGQAIASVYSKDLISVVEAFAYNQSSESILRAARNNLASWKLDVSVLRHFDLKADYRQPVDIYADFSGTVLEKHVSEGAALANAHMGQPTVLYKLADLARVWVVLEAYESDLPWIREGSSVEFTTTAHPGRLFRSKVDFIGPVVDPHTRTVEVRLVVDNREGLLKPDMLVKARLAGHLEPSHNENAPVAAPRTAVLWTGERSVVYVRDPGYDVPAFRCREVVLADNPVGEHYLVLEGLKPGEEVVVSGALVLDAEAQLSGKKSMMNRNLGDQEVPGQSLAGKTD